MLNHSEALGELIDSTLWIDTHEHLVEERHRLRGAYCFTDQMGYGFRLPSDWSVLIVQYALDDLLTAGMPSETADRLQAEDLAPLEKWDLVAPYYDAARHTGYLRAVDLTTERLFGVRLSRETVEEIDRKCRDLREAGYYRHVLRDVAGIERCQVNSLDMDPLCETATPDLLDQDLCLVPLALGRHPGVEQASGIEVANLDDYCDVVEWCFERYAPRAVAVKCFWAYIRPLAMTEVDGPPRHAFDRLRAGEAVTGERRQVEDFLLRRCVDLATRAQLPVKLHLGALGNNSQPQLRHIFTHVADVTPLVQAHPQATFVLMHMAWPLQEQLLTLAKHQPNVVVDLCWSWICAPLSTETFVQEFITTVPATKLLCFGGDYLAVESVVGHAELARRGLQRALEGLMTMGWLDIDVATDLVAQLMRENALRLYPERLISAPIDHARFR